METAFLNPAGPVQKLAASAIPFIVAPTGTMANNGAITLGTALPQTYANAYIFLPAGAIAAGVPGVSTWYFCQMSSTTVGTVFNNTYSTGIPAIPASPTAFVTTGPGAYTGITAAVTGPQVTIPAGAIGPNGVLRATFLNGFASSANSKTINYKIGATTICSISLTTVGQFGTSQCWITQNSGAQNVNTSPSTGANGGVGTLGSPGPNDTAINFAADQIASFGGSMATATEFLILRSFLIEVIPG